MKSADYPQRSCREPVWSQHGMAYSCELPDLHLGPCASMSVQASVKRRDTWEDEHPSEVGSTHDSLDIIEKGPA